MRPNYALGVVLLALVVGVVYAAPQFFVARQIWESGHQFVANQFVKLDDGGDAYFQFARQVAEGHFPPGDPFSKDKLPNIYPWLSPLLFGALIFILKDVSLAYLAGNFVFPVILFLLFYWLGQLVFQRDRLWSLFFGLVGVFTPLVFMVDRIFFNGWDLVHVVKNFYPGVRTPLATLFLARIDFPLLTLPTYLVAIAFLIIFWQKPGRSTAMAAGLFAGLLFYTYFHKWTYWVVVLGLLFVYILFFLRQDRLRLKNFIILIGTTMLTGIPYFVNYFRFTNLAGSKDLIQRLSLETGYAPNLSVWPSYLVYVLLAVLVYYLFYKKGDRLTAALYFLFLLAAVFIWNIQIITGFVPQPDHWPRAVNPLIFLIVFHLIYKLINSLESEKRYDLRIFFRVLLVVGMIFLITKKIVNATAFLSLPAQQIMSRYTLPEDVVLSYQWLNKNTFESRIISPSFITSLYLAGFTSSWPYLPFGGVTPLANLELEERFLYANKLFGVEEGVLESRLRDGLDLICRAGGDCSLPYRKSNIADTRLHLYQLYFKDRLNPRVRNIPESKIADLLERYRKLAISWSDTETDLVYYGPWERQFGEVDFSDRSGLKLVYKNGSVEVYEKFKNIK